ncbi:MAG: hypothetical protein WDM77_00655 [Steroidobacteraceae bacterium]
MGITANTIELLLAARRSGVDFSDLALIGRQQFLYFDFASYRAVIARCGQPGRDMDLADDALIRHATYADRWLSRLGKNGRVTSYDASAFEGATCVHDFNMPVPEEYRARHSALFDGGTLEHIFNVPVVLLNCMRMLKIGGHYMAALPCNQWTGHGFYQFSPELFYRVFCPDNGFVKTTVHLYCELGDAQFAVFPDPKQVGKRLEFQSSRPLSLFVVARKVADIEAFARYPQQSDYAAAWSTSAGVTAEE